MLLVKNMLHCAVAAVFGLLRPCFGDRDTSLCCLMDIGKESRWRRLWRELINTGVISSLRTSCMCPCDYRLSKLLSWSKTCLGWLLCDREQRHGGKTCSECVHERKSQRLRSITRPAHLERSLAKRSAPPPRRLATASSDYRSASSCWCTQSPRPVGYITKGLEAHEVI